MCAKSKSPALNGALTTDNQKQCLLESSTGVIPPQQYAGPAIDPAALRTLKIHVRALERANRDWRAAGNCPVDFKRVRGKWIAFENPALKTMGELVEREGRRALRFWKGIPVPEFQPWSEWVHAMTDEIDPSVLKLLEDADWRAITLAIQWVKCELNIVCASIEWDGKPGGEWRANRKMELLLAAAGSEVAVHD